MVFRTCYGLYESLAILFGLTNAPVDFQRFINDQSLYPFLDNFCMTYLDDILIYTEILQEHQKQVNKVFEVLLKAGLHLKPKKCKFYKTKVKYLGLIISTRGIKMDPKKVNAMVGWRLPKNLHDI